MTDLPPLPAPVARQARLLRLVADLRFALGDDGLRMQPELVEYAKALRVDAELYRAQRSAPPAAPVLTDARLLEIARQHLDKGLSWAPHITRCNDLEIRAFGRAVERAVLEAASQVPAAPERGEP